MAILGAGAYRGAYSQAKNQTIRKALKGKSLGQHQHPVRAVPMPTREPVQVHYSKAGKLVKGPQPPASATPMTEAERRAAYERQNRGRPLTPRQARRLTRAAAAELDRTLLSKAATDKHTAAVRAALLAH